MSPTGMSYRCVQCVLYIKLSYKNQLFPIINMYIWLEHIIALRYLLSKSGWMDFIYLWNKGCNGSNNTWPLNVGICFEGQLQFIPRRQSQSWPCLVDGPKSFMQFNERSNGSLEWVIHPKSMGQVWLFQMTHLALNHRVCSFLLSSLRLAILTDLERAMAYICTIFWVNFPTISVICCSPVYVQQSRSASLTISYS